MSSNPSFQCTLANFPFLIYPCFNPQVQSEELIAHTQQMIGILTKLIPSELLFEDKVDFLNWLGESLPLIRWKEVNAVPGCLTITLLCKSANSANTGAFFYHLLTRGLLQNKVVTLFSLHQMEFYLGVDALDKWYVAQVEVLVENEDEDMLIREKLPLFARELKLGLSSEKYARDILDSKPLVYDQKISIIRQKLIDITLKFPSYADQELFVEMSRFLALSETEFRIQRSYLHLLRLIGAQYSLRRKIIKASRIVFDRRHLYLRFLPTRLDFAFGSKQVLGLIVTVLLQDPQEFFGEKHIIQAIQKFIPRVQAVKNSCYQHTLEKIQTLYLEVEKIGGGFFSAAELRLLKNVLAEELKGRIEKLMPPVFMIRNEEEIMKNILTLSQELHDPEDIPQVMIKFEEQTATELLFSVILVQPVAEDNVKSILPHEFSGARVAVDRIQTIERLNRKYYKEATLLQIHLFKEPFLRSDFSVNTYLARQKVVALLQDVFGEIRDYTGGMISQQEERLFELKKIIGIEHHELLESFFLSMNPLEARFTQPLSALKVLFFKLLKGLEAEAPYCALHHEEEGSVAVICSQDGELKEAVKVPKSTISTCVTYRETQCLAYLCQGAGRETIAASIQKTYVNWQDKVKAQKVVRLSFPLLHSFLDPRLGGSVGNGHFFVSRMLFDGLTRIGDNGKPYLSIAESVNISADQKYYLFKLRKCVWSNGAPVTAYDFEYTWKSILSPSFKTASSYLFYPILHAKAAKEGLITLDNVRIRAIDESTLAVELAFPAPYFLELIANPLFSPVNHQVDQVHPDWAAQEGDSYICNGPFHLSKRHSFDRYVLKKNPSYWDADNVHLDQITIYKTNNVHETLEMFQKDQIDYLGRPMQPWEPFFAHKPPEIDSTPRIYWITLNVQSFPLNHPKFRQALALAINRQEIVDALSSDLIPAYTPLPREHTYHLERRLYEENASKARLLFDEALEELGLNRNSFAMPPICTFQGFLRETTATVIKRQWEQCFDIHCRVEAQTMTTLFERMTRGDYQISGIGWEPLVNDPIYTLDAFKSAREKVNFAKWENEDYQALLDAANEECDLKKRDEYLAQAEKILIEHLPIIPLYYEVGKFMKKENLYVPGIGWQMDFKYAYLQ